MEKLTKNTESAQPWISLGYNNVDRQEELHGAVVGLHDHKVAAEEGGQGGAHLLHQQSGQGGESERERKRETEKERERDFETLFSVLLFDIEDLTTIGTEIGTHFSTFEVRSFALKHKNTLIN